MDNRNVGNFKNMINNIDKEVRKPVFLLNQNNFLTFSSDAGEQNKRLPKIGITCSTLEKCYAIISLIDSYGGNVWYTLTNRWFKKDDSPEKEIEFNNEINNRNICEAFNVNRKRSYFIIIKTNTFEDLNDIVKYILENKDKL